ncbi:DNA primase [Salmonella enterica]|nr:DNA primase [Salmonella enterica]
MNEPLEAELHSLFSFDIYPGASSEQNTGVKLAMARFYLNVPFEEKDLAKQKGAQWDQEQRKWFVPQGKNPIYFIRWIKELNEHDYNVFSQRFYIAESYQSCWRCKKTTPVFGIFLPRWYKYRDVICGVDPAEWEDCILDEWYETSSPKGMEYFDSKNNMIYRWLTSRVWWTDLTKIEIISTSALSRINEYSKLYYPSHSKTAKMNYYANHCCHCNAMQGDFMMFNEPGGVFFPVTHEQAEKIRFHEVNETIFAKASYSLIPEAGGFIDL